jgi:hypothetical protein
VNEADLVSVRSEPYKRREDCVQRLNQKIAAAVEEYVQQQTNSNWAFTLLALDMDRVQKEVAPPSQWYEETIVSPSVGEMRQIHARLEFTPAFQKQLWERWLQVQAASRLAQVGLFFASALGMVATAFGFFRVDNATRGYYTGRLQLVAGGAILAMIIVGIFVARQIPWI